MRRPLALAGFAMLCGSLFCLLAGFAAARWGLAAAAVCFGAATVCHWRAPRDRRWSAWQIMSFFAGGLLGLTLLLNAAYAALARALHNTQTTLTMTVLCQSGDYDNLRYYRVQGEGTGPAAGTLELVVSAPVTLAPGDVIEETVTLRVPSVARRAGLYADRVWLTALLPEETVPRVKEVRPGAAYYAGLARAGVQRQVEQWLGTDAAGLVLGVCLGDAAGMNAALRQDFYTCGVGHVMAVSGLHTGTVAGLFLFLFMMLRSARRWARALAVAFVWAFVLVAGTPFSAMRAAVMFSVLALGTAARRKADGLNSLGAACVVILLVHPLAAGDVGFLASVATCAGIVTLADPIAARLKRLWPACWRQGKTAGFVCGSLGITAAAWLALLPVDLLCFKTVSVVTPLANMVCVPLNGVVLACGMGGAVLSAVPVVGLAGVLLLAVADLAANGMAAAVWLLAKLPLIRRPVASFWVWLALAALGGLAVWWTRRKPKRADWRRPAVALVLVAVLLAATALPALPNGAGEITVVGGLYHNAVVVTNPAGTVVIGCDAPYALRDRLAARGVEQVEWLLLPTRRTYGTRLADLLALCEVKRIGTAAIQRDRGLLQVVDLPCETPAAVTLGDWRITPAADYAGFTVTAPGFCMTVGDVARPDADYSLADRDGRAMLTDRAHNAYDVEQTLVVRVAGGQAAVYAPAALW